MVERSRPRQLAEPRPRAAASRVEALPTAQRALEGLDREVLGEHVVGGQVHEIRVNVVEMLLGESRERGLVGVHAVYTPQGSPDVTGFEVAEQLIPTAL
jgi:hypothetical protein